MVAAKSPTATTVHTTFPTTAIIDLNLRAGLRVGNFHTLASIAFRIASRRLRGRPYGGGTSGGLRATPMPSCVIPSAEAAP